MEGQFLSRNVFADENARVLRRAFQCGRKQQHFPETPFRRRCCCVGRAGSQFLPLRVKGASSNNASETTTECQRPRRSISPNCFALETTARSAAISIAAQLQEGHSAAGEIPARAWH